MVLPWSVFWERNYFLQAWPHVEPLFANAYLRGAVSGIGVLNLVAALVEFGRALTGRE
ncbi:MAG: hypothetical protein U0Q11_21975 [Vicinamibacterales bacterium]